ncbi:GlxA family transcriptional regulator [Defluviimonas salinarum]|uniref:GlxA family transcriptional regulator n=1 Tax=Defluviimonas salinarum TaxID=2992147 RepID=A0ABT3IZU0_9RHOB|nr:GlxA family transcriptional regulator [Defluviimonas salinarum]MCW3780949.1 GlxA family transcriptional regulator [Defluviimonas salinarum]
MSHQSPIRALHRVPAAAPAPTPAKSSFVFLLLDGFTHIALASAIEPLRLAREILGRDSYSWRLVSLTGAPATCSNGMTVLVESGFAPLARGETLIVVGGPETRRQNDARLSAQLRREAAHGVKIGSLCMGVYALARSGLLDGEECAVHWDAIEGFGEEFPEIRISRNAFVLGRRPTAPGGAVAADMMMHLIAETHGTDVATRIADQMVCNGVRSPKSQQKVSIQSRYGMRNPRLVKVLNCMEQNLETPLTAQEIADIAAMSVRQTERLFARYLNTTPMNFYMQMRLEKAHSLLLQTELSVTEIAVACGYKSTSHFTKNFRAAYDVTPKKMRAVSA